MKIAIDLGTTYSVVYVVGRGVVLREPSAVAVHRETGDVIAVPAAGAYCLAMASNYNGMPRPEVVMVRDGDARVMRRRETLDDLLAAELF